MTAMKERQPKGIVIAALVLLGVGVINLPALELELFCRRRLRGSEGA